MLSKMRLVALNKCMVDRWAQSFAFSILFCVCVCVLIRCEGCGTRTPNRPCFPTASESQSGRWVHFKSLNVQLYLCVNQIAFFNVFLDEEPNRNFYLPHFTVLTTHSCVSFVLNQQSPLAVTECRWLTSATNTRTITVVSHTVGSSWSLSVGVELIQCVEPTSETVSE